MYKIVVKSDGKYHNVVGGARYCLTRKSAKKLIDIFLPYEVNIEVYKLIRLYNDVFYWAGDDFEDKIFDYYHNKINEKDC